MEVEQPDYDKYLVTGTADRENAEYKPGEEMVFRGVLQQVVQGKSRRAHWAIWTCAFLFSAIHLQFYGFFPRLLLGAFFGYLLVWSRNLWLPIFGHFLNNSMVVCIAYVTGNASDNTLEALGTAQSSTEKRKFLGANKVITVGAS